ncbi:hypothetical protein GCM10023264_10620 [Sphingomonas daechungensis]|uniref:Histidine kinase n=1 Tax=Sphingomonas daechungensis TaxID=1176646 RepID=A0ABX6T511_9SPHN|nr:histidine kinase [Sphingomonas daechungensis]QNP44619.1 histidine kinase [Sphingomonas daechungensis]
MVRPEVFSSAERRSFRREALALTVAVWVAHYVIFTARDFVVQRAQLATVVVLRTGWTLMGAAICAAIYFILGQFRDSRFATQLFIAGLLCFPAAFIQAGAVYFSKVATGVPLTIEGSMLMELVRSATSWVWIYFGWAVCLLALQYNLRARREQRLRAEALALAHEAQMRALRYQLNPHFLFNTLNSIAALMLDGNARVAETMLRKLSGFLRQGLAGDSLDDVQLQHEVDHQRLYFDIEQLRFPERLSVEVDIPDELRNALVPSFILQPIVENAVKYAVAPSNERTTIRIVARDVGGMLQLSVTDDGKAGSKGLPGTGIGLVNVQKRLASRFGDRYTFDDGPLSPNGYRVEFALPLKKAAA